MTEKDVANLDAFLGSLEAGQLEIERLLKEFKRLEAQRQRQELWLMIVGVGGWVVAAILAVMR